MTTRQAIIAAAKLWAIGAAGVGIPAAIIVFLPSWVTLVMTFAAMFGLTVIGLKGHPR